MKKKYDYAVCIGRFQPVHNGHISFLNKAAFLADRVIILVGSSFNPRNIKNPFTFEERKELLLSSLPDTAFYTILPLHDYYYSDTKWITEVQQIVSDNTTSDNIVLLGHDKGDTTRYLSWFPQWKFENCQEVALAGLDATTIRNLYYEGQNINFLRSVVPQESLCFLVSFLSTPEYRRLVAEHLFIKQYKKAWDSAPYSPTFVTADAVVVQDGHILLIRRKAEPGAGLMALPGGFVQSDETMEQAMVRELREETALKLPVKVIRGSIKADKVFDAPNRSLRGRTITQAFYIVLESTGELPRVKGMDDAEKAFWLPLSELREEELFEDHYSIIQYFL